MARLVLRGSEMGASAVHSDRTYRKVIKEDEPVSGVRPRPALPDFETAGPSAVLEVVTPRKANRLHAGYRAMLDLGMRIVRAEVRAVGSHVLQKLYLREADERALSDDRLSAARAALRDVHGASRLLEPERAKEQPRAKPLRTSRERMGAVKWQR